MGSEVSTVILTLNQRLHELKPKQAELARHYIEEYERIQEMERKNRADGATAKLIGLFDMRGNYSNVREVRRLIALGADVNASVGPEKSPLMVSSIQKFDGNLPVLQALWTAGARPDPLTSFGGRALAWGALLGFTPLIEYCLQNGVPVNRLEKAHRGLDEFEGPPLFFAAYGGQAEAARLLLAAGSDPNLTAKGLSKGLSQRNLTLEGAPLFFAVRSGSLETVRLLLKAGSDPNRMGKGFGDGADVAPIDAAAGGGSTELLNLLIDSGATLTETALYHAVAGRQTSLALGLLGRGVSVSTQTLVASVSACESGTLFKMEELVREQERVRASGQVYVHDLKEFNNRLGVHMVTNGRCSLDLVEKLMRRRLGLPDLR